VRMGVGMREGCKSIGSMGMGLRSGQMVGNIWAIMLMIICRGTDSLPLQMGGNMREISY